MLDTETGKSIIDAVADRQVDNTIIVTFANSAYVAVLLNWLVSIDLLGIGNYLVFSLDREIHAFLSGKNIPTILLPLHGDLKSLWNKRVEIFHFFGRNGIDFVHTDVDAIWFRDPVAEYFTDQESAVVFSQGTVFPPVVHEQWGFVLCCGLFYIRSHHDTAPLLEDWSRNIQTIGDDQYALNVALASRKLVWNIDDTCAHPVQYRDYRFTCFDTVLRGTIPESKLSVALLPQHLFQRIPMQESAPYIRHYLSPKNTAAKMQMFSQTNSLLLNSNWRNITFDADSLQNIAVDPGSRLTPG